MQYRNMLYVQGGIITMHLLWAPAFTWLRRLWPNTSVFIDNNLFLFQIKADHDANETYPILTFGLKEEFGLYIDKHTEGVAKSEEIPVALIDAIKGQWIQVRNNVY